ncbi:tetratricopeptide repeat protein [Shewanella sp. SNU WT4]|uniref:tetratricopeptide repeat protein n=1 Tax=Shewanella sp. SNU WT4 TaxID=2590015 RepID=UPI0011276244|nr:tetratricopeptide repeat protein [Shewanella sp. SNU WT4]QDF68034.1 tetratricopeptide repeat protein [Shewanella sp. SNU WT4]
MQYFSRLWLIHWLMVGVLVGCASEPIVPSWRTLLIDDALIVAAPDASHASSAATAIETPIPTPEQVFALSEAAQQSLLKAMRQAQLSKGSRFQAHQWLASELDTSKGRFSYDGYVTQTAEQTFASRQGNCMSLVVLASSMAKVLDIPVTYQVVEVSPHWDRQGQFHLLNGHINIRLSAPQDVNRLNFSDDIQLDFLPEATMRQYRDYQVQENTVLALFYNNLAAEALINNDALKAYRLIKLSLTHDPLAIAINTLALIYRHQGLDKEAETAYHYGRLLEPDDMSLLHNLAILLSSQGRLDEWAQIHQKIELSRIANPFYYFDMAEQAYRDGDYNSAIDWYQRALGKADYRPEFYHGLAKSYFRQGQVQQAQNYLQKALQLSLNDKERQRYRAKLDSLTHVD